MNDEAKTSREKIGSLEGLRGVAAFVVFFAHFVGAFYPAFLFNDPKLAHVPYQIETRLAPTPLGVVFDGELAVCVFFVLSGYVLSAGFFARPSRLAAGVSFLKRYLRLEIPILASVLLGWFLLAFDWTANLQVLELTKSQWFGRYAVAEPSLGQALRGSLIGVFIHGQNEYNPLLWTMKVELLGSYLVYGLLLVFGRSRWRFAGYLAATALLLESYYALFVVGMALSSVRPWTQSLASRPMVRRLGWALLIVGVLVGTYPCYYDPKGTWWWQVFGSVAPMAPKSYPRLAAPLILGALLVVPRLQSFFSSKIPRFLGRISFSLYLIHFLILASASSWLFLALAPHAPYNVCGFVTFVVSVALVLVASDWMTRAVDQPAIRLSHRSVGAIVDRLVRLGDAKRSFHWSIGTSTNR